MSQGNEEEFLEQFTERDKIIECFARSSAAKHQPCRILLSFSSMGITGYLQYYRKIIVMFARIFSSSCFSRITLFLAKVIFLAPPNPEFAPANTYSLQSASAKNNFHNFICGIHNCSLRRRICAHFHTSVLPTGEEHFYKSLYE